MNIARKTLPLIAVSAWVIGLALGAWEVMRVPGLPSAILAELHLADINPLEKPAKDEG